MTATQKLDSGVPVLPLDSGEIDDRYRLYVSALERARRWILGTTSPGEYRTWLLSMNRIMFKEEFEARMQAVFAAGKSRLELFDRDLREAA